jgi:hypothetical protein
MISRRQLYEAGEPLGDCATRRKIGGGLILGIGGDSSSSSTTLQTTNNYDQRRVQDASVGGTLLDHSQQTQIDNRVDNRGGVAGNGNTSVVTDLGAVQAGTGVALSALNKNAHNIDTLLATADHLFTQQQSSLDANVNLTRQLASTAQTAYSDAAAGASGQKNLILAGIAVVGIVAFTALSKK